MSQLAQTQNQYHKDSDGLQVVRLTTRQKGSWRWQDACGLSYYQPRPRRKYRKGQSYFIWDSIYQGPNMSYPQARWRGLDWENGIPSNSIHQQSVDGWDLMGLALMSEMLKDEAEYPEW